MSDAVRLETAVFESGQAGPHLLITAGVHGDEFEPIAAVSRLVEALRIQSVKLTQGKLTLVPIANQAAYLRGTRTAEDGWIWPAPVRESADGSITERIAHVLSDLIRQADHYIDLHSGGLAYEVLPMSGHSLHPDVEVRRKQRRMAEAFNLPFIWATTPYKEGRTLSIARDANIPAIYAEYLGAGGCSLEGVDAYEQGCLNVLSLLEMIERPLPELQPIRIVEDERPDSGHMQVCYPAPFTGIFEPAVQLGQFVRRGEPLGRLYDPVSGNSQTIPVEASGMVLVLRAFRRVREESLGVIVEMDE